MQTAKKLYWNIDTIDYVTSEEAFLAYLEIKKTEDDNWKFWTSFEVEDSLAFINLYLAVCGEEWDLRIASLKQMAAIFTACDRQHYSKLIPQHLADCAKMPDTIIRNFSKGGFTLSITGRNWHSVSFDKGHEILINKDLKTAIVRPNAEYMSRLSLYFTHRMKALKILRLIVDDQKSHKHMNTEEERKSKSLVDNSTTAKKRNENVNKMREVIKSSLLLQKDTPDNKTLQNSFTGETATPEQREIS